MNAQSKKGPSRLAMIDAAMAQGSGKGVSKFQEWTEIEPAKTRMNSIHGRLPGSVFGPEFEDLKASITASGQIQPAKGYYLPKPDPDGVVMELVYGARRREACLALGRALKVEVIPPPTAIDVVKLMHGENRGRKDYTAIDRVREFRSYREVLNCSNEEVTQAIGISRPYGVKLAAILEMPTELLSLFESAPLQFGLTECYELAQACRDEAARNRLIECALQLKESPTDDMPARLKAAAKGEAPQPERPAPAADRIAVYVGKKMVGQVFGLQSGDLKVSLTEKAPAKLLEAVRKVLLENLPKDGGAGG